MKIELEVWQLLSLLATIAGAFFGLAKTLLAQTKSQINEKFTALHKVLESQTETARRLERELLELKAELPRDYVRREDYVQAVAIVMTKIDSLGLRMENMFNELVFKGDGVSNIDYLQLAKIRREQIRWYLLVAINVSRPVGIYTEALLPIIQATYPDATHQELRKELDYLADRELVAIKRDPTERWFCDLMRYGIDVVEYTVDCDPGIARPRYGQG